MSLGFSLDLNRGPFRTS